MKHYNDDDMYDPQGLQNARNGTSPHLGDELLAAWAANELSGDERERARRHLASCDACQRALAQTQRIGTLLRASDQPGAAPMPSLVGSVLERLPMREISNTASARSTTITERTRPVEDETTIPEQRVLLPQHASVWRRVGALAAVALLIATSALLFTRFAMHDEQPSTGPSSSPVISTWQHALPSGAQVADVAVVSQDDIWVAGTINTGTASNALLMHYDGHTWQRSQDQFENVSLTSISMASATDGWAAGRTTSYPSNHPALLHYSNGHWRDAASTLNNLIDATWLTQIRMGSATSGWLLGTGEYATNSGRTQKALIFEYTKVGNEYSWEPLNGGGGNVIVDRYTGDAALNQLVESTDLSTLSVVSDHEVWVAGRTANASQQGIIFRINATFDNGQNGQPSVELDLHSWNLSAGSITGLDMRSSTEGWATGITATGNVGFYEWDGQHWNAQPFTAGVAGESVGGVIMTESGSGWFYSAGVSNPFLYALQGGTWYGFFPLSQGKIIGAMAPLSATEMLAFAENVTQSAGNTDYTAPEPVIYSIQMGKHIDPATGTPVVVSTPSVSGTSTPAPGGDYATPTPGVTETTPTPGNPLPTPTPGIPSTTPTP